MNKNLYSLMIFITAFNIKFHQNSLSSSYVHADEGTEGVTPPAHNNFHFRQIINTICADLQVFIC